jgi:hypothetical protein
MLKKCRKQDIRVKELALLFCFVAHIGKTFSLNYYLLNFAEQSKAKKPGKQHNILPLWGNEATMNLNPLILGIFK